MSDRSVAVILPTIAGREAWLEESVRSLCGQRVRICLHVCANGNGSSALDHVRSITKKYPSMSLHYYSYATNSPEHISYVQTQVKACNYKYILDWTDDDRRLPSSLLSQVQRLEQNQAAVFCCGPAQQIDHNGDQIDGAIYRGGGLGEVLTFKNFVVTCPIVMGSVLWKAEHYDPTVKQPSRIGGEWPKYIKALSKHGSYAINLPQVLTQLRIHDKSDTEVNGFRKNEFVEMHMGMWKQLVEDYHYQPTMQQWDEMTNIILGLLARKYDPFSGEPFPGPGFEEFRAFRSKYGVNK